MPPRARVRLRVERPYVKLPGGTVRLPQGALLSRPYRVMGWPLTRSCAGGRRLAWACRDRL